ncbi:MAG: hypothetical protein ACE5J2_01510 [Nitrososphaerales archaeon]
MATRKGIALTVIIIGGFVGASFLVYFIPSPPQVEIVGPSDTKERLMQVMETSNAVVDEFQSNFEMWKKGELDRDGFDETATVAINQVDGMILDLRRSNISEEWIDSYDLYIQALENYRAYFEKGKDYVSTKSAGNLSPEHGNSLFDSMLDALDQAEDLALASDVAMPE